MPHRVFVDADVLASRTLFDWLALLRDETDGAFRLHSSPAVVGEAVRLWRSLDPAAREAAAPRRVALLTAGLDEVMDADTDAGPGPAGRLGGSALEEAVASGAHVLLTSRALTNQDDDRLPFEVWTPDEFLCLVDDDAAAAVRHLTRQRAAEPLVDALVAADCPAFASRVAGHLRTDAD